MQKYRLLFFTLFTNRKDKEETLKELPGLNHNYMLGYNFCQLYDEPVCSITALLTKGQ